jgi:hypothetical protein
MIKPARPTDVELQLQSTKEPVTHVGRVSLPPSRPGKLHVRREVCYGQRETLCGQWIFDGYMKFKPVNEAIKDISDIDCMSCRRIAGLGSIAPRKS